MNVIDCNLCVKGEDLDSQQGVIDFSLYLRSSSRSSPEEEQPAIEGGNMTAVLDQKNYIEELNRHLKYFPPKRLLDCIQLLNFTARPSRTSSRRWSS